MNIGAYFSEVERKSNPNFKIKTKFEGMNFKNSIRERETIELLLAVWDEDNMLGKWIEREDIEMRKEMKKQK